VHFVKNTSSHFWNLGWKTFLLMPILTYFMTYSMFLTLDSLDI
jgi:hypothetical protein